MIINIQNTMNADKKADNMQKDSGNNSENYREFTEDYREESENDSKKQSSLSFTDRFLLSAAETLETLGKKILELVLLLLIVAIGVPVLWFIIVCEVAFWLIKIIFFW